MGSVVSLPTVISLALITGGIFYGFVQKHGAPPDWAQSSNRAVLPDEVVVLPETKGKKKKKAAAKGTAPSASQTEVEPTVVSFPAVVPGALDQPEPVAEQASAAAAKSKKKKKTKKTAGGAQQVPLDAQSDSSATAPESSTPVPRPAKRKSTPVLDADGPWTRVESRKRGAVQQQQPSTSSAAPEPPASDAGITTSVTGTSSPVTERTTEDEQPLGTADGRRTLAERLLPKPRKTHVEECVRAQSMLYRALDS
jgi:hypothetical protein